MCSSQAHFIAHKWPTHALRLTQALYEEDTMISYENIESEFDAVLLDTGKIVVRNIRERTEEGNLVESPEVQFQVTNISGSVLVGLDAEINYYSASDEFTGSDSDCRLETLSPGEKHTFSLVVDPPEQANRAELQIVAKRQRLIDRIPFPLQMVFWLGILGYFIYINAKS